MQSLEELCRSKEGIFDFRMKLFEMCACDQVHLISGETKRYSQLEKKRIDREPEIQSKVICGSKNVKLRSDVYAFLQDLREINLFKKMASDTEEVKVFLYDSETSKGRKDLFCVSFRLEHVTSWLLWSERQLVITTYEAVLHTF